MNDMRYIVGLGNPGPEYIFTRHNVGFMILDLLQKSYGGQFKRDARLSARVCTGMISGKNVTFVKPWLFMNKSGVVVNRLPIERNTETSAVENVLVIVDDVNLPFGSIRYRESGSHGGQNGMRSIINCCGTALFHRLRIGIGSEKPVFDLHNYVLGNFSSSEEPVLKNVLQVSAESVEWYCAHGIQSAMNKYNGAVT